MTFGGRCSTGKELLLEEAILEFLVIRAVCRRVGGVAAGGGTVAVGWVDAAVAKTSGAGVELLSSSL